MVLVVYQISYESVRKRMFCTRLSWRVHFVQRRRKILIKSVKFQVCVTSKLRGVFLSNLLCEVVYIGGTTYINLEEICSSNSF